MSSYHLQGTEWGGDNGRCLDVARRGARLCEERVGAERQQKSEERNTNREGVASGSAT